MIWLPVRVSVRSVIVFGMLPVELLQHERP